MTTNRLSLPVILLIILVLIACEGTSSATGQPAPCGRVDDTKYYGGRNYTCTSTGWQHDPK